jgi:hypothetical protein
MPNKARAVLVRAGACKHGRYTAEAILSRREAAALIRAMKDLTRFADVNE